MKTIAEAHSDSTAPASDFFSRWADMDTWPQWNADTEWARLDGPFAEGSSGELKPKGAPKVRFVIERLVPGREFVDVSRLPGARLTFAHLVDPLPDGGCSIAVRVTIDGPLAPVWSRIMGSGLRESAGPDLERLVALVEAGRAPAGVPDTAVG